MKTTMSKFFLNGQNCIQNENNKQCVLLQNVGRKILYFLQGTSLRKLYRHILQQENIIT